MRITTVQEARELALAQKAERRRARREAQIALAEARRDAEAEARRLRKVNAEELARVRHLAQQAQDESDVHSDAAVQRLRAMLRSPMYAYAPEAQGDVIDAIDAIPVEIRKKAFGLRKSADPLMPIAEGMIEVLGWGDSTLALVGWLWGVSRERIRQHEASALAKLRLRNDVKALRNHLEDDHVSCSSRNGGTTE